MGNLLQVRVFMTYTLKFYRKDDVYCVNTTVQRLAVIQRFNEDSLCHLKNLSVIKKSLSYAC